MVKQRNEDVVSNMPSVKSLLIDSYQTQVVVYITMVNFVDNSESTHTVYTINTMYYFQKWYVLSLIHSHLIVIVLH